MSKVIETDVLIIGSGLAGLLAAIKLLESGSNVFLVCKTGLAESNSRYAQGGIAAAAPTAPAPALQVPGGKAPIEAHLADTIKAGAGLVDKVVASEIVGNGWQLIESLSHYGVVFDHLPNGSYSLAREGGHSAARVYHHQDVTGTWICNALIEHLRSSRRLKVIEHSFASQLLIKDGYCVGAELIRERENYTAVAKHTVLATGGIGQVFSRTTNPSIATGDGIAMAYRAGAQLIDMEFVQFHPTALDLHDKSDLPTVLISEAVRGAGALLLDHNKERFMTRFDPDGELATRDIVARSMCQVMEETGQKIFLDLRPIGKKTLQEHFPHILQQLSQHGINALEALVPVSPAAHYFMGGIKANCDGTTSVSGLYAIGECASTGLHGANRLASNSLLEAGVMGLKAAEFISRDTKSVGLSGNHGSSAVLSPFYRADNLRAMRQAMFAKAGVIRDGKSLEQLITSLDGQVVQANDSVKEIEEANLLLIAKLIASTALRRIESRGAHYRSDYPNVSEKLAMRQIVFNNGQANEQDANKYEWTGGKNLCPSPG